MSTQEMSQDQSCFEFESVGADDGTNKRCDGCIIPDIPDIFVASLIEVEPTSQRVTCSGVLGDGSELSVEMPVHSLVAIALRHSAQFVTETHKGTLPT